MLPYARLLALVVFQIAPLALAGGDDALSADDTSKLVAQARDRAAEDNCSSFTTPGIDHKKGTVTVDEADLKLRQSWLDDALVDTGGWDSGARGAWKKVARDCKLPRLPKVTIDVAVVKLWRIGCNGSAGRAQPLEYFTPGAAQDDDSFSCPYVESPDQEKSADKQKVRQLMQKTKLIHYVLDPNWTRRDGHYAKHESGGFTYRFDKKSGELTIGVHTEGSNLYKNWNEFIRKVSL